MEFSAKKFCEPCKAGRDIFKNATKIRVLSRVDFLRIEKFAEDTEIKELNFIFRI